MKPEEEKFNLRFEAPVVGSSVNNNVLPVQFQSRRSGNFPKYQVFLQCSSLNNKNKDKWTSPMKQREDRILSSLFLLKRLTIVRQQSSYIYGQSLLYSVDFKNN